MKTKTLADFQILIKVTLSGYDQKSDLLYTKGVTGNSFYTMFNPIF